MESYQILLHKETLGKAEVYLKKLRDGVKAGNFLSNLIQGKPLQQMTTVELIELLLNTKNPQIFAERALYGDGADWTHDELSILGDISVMVPVTVYDNGMHHRPEIFNPPFEATLIFVPGALLRNDRNCVPADWGEITRNDKINSEAYYELYERRLLPGFLMANETAGKRGKKAFVTIPGLGCGEFAGKFRGKLGAQFQNTLKKILEKHGPEFPHIKAVYFDPYSECANIRLTINGIIFFVRPLTQGNQSKPQLCPPKSYEETGDDFSSCDLFSFVAWDHLSWPGNDFWVASRATDDGVKAAATNSMKKMTGIEGKYDPVINQYQPPEGFKNWKEVATKNKIQITAKDNLFIFPKNTSPAP